MYEVQPLSKALYKKAKDLNITKIHFLFSGGSDEGWLSVDVEVSSPSDSIRIMELQEELENWGYKTYEYSGAGDGTPYGDNYIYDLANKTMTHNSWYTTEVVQEGGDEKLEFENVE